MLPPDDHVSRKCEYMMEKMRLTLAYLVANCRVLVVIPDHQIVTFAVNDNPLLLHHLFAILIRATSEKLLHDATGSGTDDAKVKVPFLLDFDDITGGLIDLLEADKGVCEKKKKKCTLIKRSGTWSIGQLTTSIPLWSI
jgi:hypothetical protein